MRTIEWDFEQRTVKMIDQRIIPGRFEILTYQTAEQVSEAIRTMVVRGAPAIGAAAAFAMALTAVHSQAQHIDDLRAEMERSAEFLIASRPTAVNLAWAVNKMMAVSLMPAETCAELAENMLNAAQALADEDVATNQRMGAIGADLIVDGDVIIHHCNTGALATVDWGTALGVIRSAHEQGKHFRVLVDETRPRLQGARLTAWELKQLGIPYEIIPDNAAGHFLRRGEATKVFFGADRVAANGDVANKIGSYMLALAAHANGVPVYAVFPTSTVDLSLTAGDQIPIEERDPQEVLGIQYQGEPVAPQGAQARNPAFDVTPYHLFTGLVTEKGIVFPPFQYNLARIMGA